MFTIVKLSFFTGKPAPSLKDGRNCELSKAVLYDFSEESVHFSELDDKFFKRYWSDV